jgi:hypothetical protein
VKYSECKPNQVLVEGGVYAGSEEGTYGIQHNFTMPDGTTTVLNSAGQLNHLVDKYCNAGDLVRITYVNKVTLTKGAMKGKEAHNFELEVDDEPKTERVNGAAVAATVPQDNDITL